VVATWPSGPVPGGLRQLGEVPSAVAMQGDATAEAPPRPAYVGVGFGPGPLLQGLLADGKQHRAAPLALGAHDMHAL
jgi:hypothetical protein